MTRRAALSESIDTRQGSPDAVVALIEEATRAEPDHRLLRTSPTAFQVLRRARSSPFSPFRRTEALLIHVSPRAGRVYLEVSGSCSPALAERLRAIGATPPPGSATPPVAPNPSTVGRPGATSPSSAWAEAQSETILRDQASDVLPPVPSAHSTPLLRLPDGSVERVDCRLVLGRNPASSAEPGTQRPVVIADPSVSKTHCEVWAEGGVVQVVDRHSRNGTHRVGAGTDVAQLVPDQPTAIEPGIVIRLGQVPLRLEAG